MLVDVSFRRAFGRLDAKTGQARDYAEPSKQIERSLCALAVRHRRRFGGKAYGDRYDHLNAADGPNPLDRCFEALMVCRTPPLPTVVSLRVVSLWTMRTPIAPHIPNRTLRRVAAPYCTKQ